MLNGKEKYTFFADVKTIIKINTLWFYGPSNAGKNLITNYIVESARFILILWTLTKGLLFHEKNAPGKRDILINAPDIVGQRTE